MTARSEAIEGMRRCKAGQRYGRLTVVRYAEKRRVICICDCGRESRPLSFSLLAGTTVSCGCYRREQWRFQRSHVSPEPNTGCWLWAGAVNVAGYGLVRRNGKTTLAHRTAWAERYGDVDPGKMVCHKCDNPPCVNPDHLFLGTNSDNQRDSVAKGRRPGQSVTSCPKGHAYTEANTYIWKRADGRASRNCRACSNERRRRYR